MARLNQKMLKDQNNFLAVSKDWAKITDKILSNKKLLKLIYYTSPDALEQNDLTEEQKLSLINKNILCYPYIPTTDDVNNYIEILFDNFVPNEENTEYINNTITLTILCNKENWILNNWNMRLYLIANELMNLINGKKLTGIGEVNFIGGTSFIPSDNIFGITLNFLVINSINLKE